MNFASILVLLGVIALVVFCVYLLVSKKAGGCSDCGACGGDNACGGCSDCAHGASCQQHRD